MQLDDVVHSSVTGPRLEEATHRSLCVTFKLLLIFVATFDGAMVRALDLRSRG